MMRPSPILARLALAAAGLTGVIFGQQQPSITSLNPASIAAGSATFTITVIGQNFAAGGVVFWNGLPLASQFVDSTQLIVTVPAGLVAAPGSATIAVYNQGGVQSNNATFQITAPGSLTITTSVLPAAVIGTPYSVALAGTGGTAPYTWSSVGALPAGLTLSAAGVIAGTPTTGGSFSFTVRLTDNAQASTTKAFTLTVNAVAISIATTSPLPAGSIGKSYSVTMTAVGGAAPYKWAAGTGLPAGLTLNATSGVLSGTPTTAGTFNFNVQVTDAGQATASGAFALTINSAGLTITTVPPLFTGSVGAPYAQSFSAAGGTAPYRWSISSGDAGGLTMDAASGTLQGTPQNVGTFTFTVRVSDNAGASASQSFSVVIGPPQLTITSSLSSTTGTVGAPYSQKFSVAGGTPPYTFAMSGNPIPGLAFNTATATLEGTPATGGSFPFTIQVTDSRGFSGTRSFTLNITAAALRITSSTQLPETVVGEPYSQEISATGGVPPYNWVTNGLPEGLSMDAATGIISGTPAVAGSLTFTVRVIDSSRNSAVDLFRINIALPTPPLATISGLPSVVKAADQPGVQVTLDSAYLVPVSGQALLTFAPDSGAGDSTIQFAKGGRTADFEVPAGSTEGPVLAIQTGTVAGTITISLRLQAAGIDITPSPAPAITARVERAAPVINSVRLIRNAGALSIEVTGFSTAREVTQATFTFSAAGGQTLQTSQVTVPVENAFSQWFQDASSVRLGSQFTLTQAFSVQGDVNAVQLQSVTLANRVGSATSSSITQ